LEEKSFWEIPITPKTDCSWSYLKKLKLRSLIKSVLELDEKIAVKEFN